MLVSGVNTKGNVVEVPFSAQILVAVFDVQGSSEGVLRIRTTVVPPRRDGSVRSIRQIEGKRPGQTVLCSV